MGQRHQIYFILPNKITFKDEMGDEVTSNVFGLHHQWLYGLTAGEMAKQFLGFADIDMASRYSKLAGKYSENETATILTMLYSIRPADGYYHGVYALDEATLRNPMMGDNNDGITVFDLRGDKPKYCLMYLHDGDILKAKVPVHAYDYALEYYGLQALAGTEYTLEEQRILSSLINDVGNRYELLTTEELEKVFPDMFV